MYRGYAYAGQGHYDLAIADFNAELSRDPTDKSALMARAHTYQDKGQQDKGQPEKAIADFSAVLRVNPGAGNREDVEANNDLAWLLATWPEAAWRDGRRAVQLATRACDISKWHNAAHLDTLAAAYAACDEFEQAVKWQQKAMELAPKDQKDNFRSRLKLYQAGKPFRSSKFPGADRK